MNPDSRSKPTPPSPLSKDKISSQTREKTEAVKLFIESTTILLLIYIKTSKKGKYSKLKQTEYETKQNWCLLQQKMQDLNLTNSECDQITHSIQQKESQKLRIK